MSGLDSLDEKIIREIDADSRMPASRIAKRVRASKETVNYRIKRLVEEGYIPFFYTVFNMNKLGFQYYKVLIKLQRVNSSLKDDLREYIRSQRCCANFRVLEGSYDLDFLSIVEGPNDLKGVLGRLKEEFGEYILDKEVHNVVETHIFNSVTGPKKFSKASVKDSVEIDDLDKSIMNVLARNGRIKFTELGERVSADPKVVAYRVKRMEKDGIIVGHTSKLDFEKMGRESFQVNISLKRYADLPEVLGFFDSTKKCTFAHNLLGKYDLSAEVHVDGTRELSSIMDDFRHNFSQRYNYADVSNVIQEHVISWSPFR